MTASDCPNIYFLLMKISLAIFYAENPLNALHHAFECPLQCILWNEFIELFYFYQVLIIILSPLNIFY